MLPGPDRAPRAAETRSTTMAKGLNQKKNEKKKKMHQKKEQQFDWNEST